MRRLSQQFRGELRREGLWLCCWMSRKGRVGELQGSGEFGERVRGQFLEREGWGLQHVGRRSVAFLEEKLGGAQKEPFVV